MASLFRFFFIFFIIQSQIVYPQASIPDSLNILLNNSKNIDEKLKILNKISNYYLDINPEIAVIYADSVLKLSKKTKNIKAISDAYVNHANYFYIKGDLDSALFYFQKSYEEIKKSDKEKHEIAAALNRLGLIYEAKSDYSIASEYLLEAVKIFEEINNEKGIADVYNNLGIIEDRLQNIDKALEYYNMSLELNRKIGSKSGEANVLNNIASEYSDKNDYQKALKYFRESLNILLKINRFNEAAVTFSNIGNIYENHDKTDSALYYYQKSLEIYDRVDSKHGKAGVYNNIANILMKKKNYNEAFNYYEKSLELRKKVGSLSSTKNTLYDIYQAYLKIENYKKAHKFYKEYIQLNDCILSSETHLKITELQMKYNTEKKDKEIKLLTKDSQIRKNFNLLLIAIISGLLIIISLAFYSVRTKTKLLNRNRLFYEQQEEINQLDMQKQKAENTLLETEVKKQQELNILQKENYQNELEHTRRELTTSAMHLLNKNKILASIQNSLKEIYLHPNHKPAQKANKIIKQIDKSIHLDSDWEQFKLHFDKVNTGFMNKLREEYPELTKNDLKVCAYLRINLSTKEIAQMLNISVAGVNKRFYRLRKKINLSTEKSLTKFFMNYK